MSLDFEQLQTMRQKLAEDRETCGNSRLAQKYLNECENLQNSLVPDLAEKLVGTDETDTAELRAMAADLSRWDEEIDAIPASEHGSASYRAALEFFRILRANYAALF